MVRQTHILNFSNFPFIMVLSFSNECKICGMLILNALRLWCENMYHCSHGQDSLIMFKQIQSMCELMQSCCCQNIIIFSAIMLLYLCMFNQQVFYVGPCSASSIFDLFKSCVCMFSQVLTSPNQIIHHYPITWKANVIKPQFSLGWGS